LLSPKNFSATWHGFSTSIGRVRVIALGSTSVKYNRLNGRNNPIGRVRVIALGSTSVKYNRLNGRNNHASE
jgi:hypothetical protein